MIDFFKRLFGPSDSGATAKQRLQLVLMTDHLALAPEMIDAMKRELVEVISRYVEVDREKVEVDFERHDHALAMMANVPILGVARPSERAPEPLEPAQPVAAQPAAAGAPPLQQRKRRKKAQRAPA
ncbi:MAG: cell division topological specificity factor MinE [Candidatus Eremiobacteraeota bacterium]|uniref:Cell division topological specificity factor (Modular protein) n=1 Tax=mine drainage metagenome TaxID=410659 RepID=E6Q7I9_9ZZZZ|nr:cell division topological specificity factor MinE [Candidatus Eremiobacteraeota bacterium]